jgi:hypothetical protein
MKKLVWCFLLCAACRVVSPTLYATNITNYPVVTTAAPDDWFLLSNVGAKTNRNLPYPDLYAQLATNLEANYLNLTGAFTGTIYLNPGFSMDVGPNGWNIQWNSYADALQVQYSTLGETFYFLTNNGGTLQIPNLVGTLGTSNLSGTIPMATTANTLTTPSNGIPTIIKLTNGNLVLLGRASTPPPPINPTNSTLALTDVNIIMRVANAGANNGLDIQDDEGNLVFFGDHYTGNLTNILGPFPGNYNALIYDGTDGYILQWQQDNQFKLSGGTSGASIEFFGGTINGFSITGSSFQGSTVQGTTITATNGFASYGTGVALVIVTTGITNKQSVNYRLMGLTGVSVVQTNPLSHVGFSRGSITVPTDITLQPNEFIQGTSVAVQGQQAF